MGTHERKAAKKRTSKKSRNKLRNETPSYSENRAGAPEVLAQGSDVVTSVEGSTAHSKCGDCKGETEKTSPARVVKKRCKQKVMAQMDVIITTLIKKAKEGSCSHAKFLIDFADEDEKSEECGTTVTEEDESSLAELLLRRLDADESDPAVRTSDVPAQRHAEKQV